MTDDAVRIIGAGWGRTGTTSVAAALERLGAGPVCHMSRMFTHPDEARLWAAYRRGEPALDRLEPFYRSGVDWPFCWAWRELAQRHPDAPVLLTVRDPHEWYASLTTTVHPRSRPGRVFPGDQPAPEGLALVQLVWDTEFGSWEAVLDEEATVAAYERHVADVRATCPPERLVEWSVGDGWEPLARALGVAVPAEPFPHLNARREAAGSADPPRTRADDRG
ncbi:sulfotransferase family protein [Lapillicoccus jejuensis]|uniref:Sulfotransferase family protein n=1 Tax=Lapillicoccus jejuensis TaxID=402171 RepID=A0A542DY94_9MICO|nr:sulfotransferase family protein [Lapillicoccus jejuensis]TQJ08070.1 hypothetical protein FB458_1150 [Lapillicoccus jejuensis]